MHRQILAAALALMLLARSAHADPQIGDRAPPLSLVTLDGKPLRLEPNRASIVDFYATWCGPCQQALAAFSGIRRVLGPGYQLVIVDVSESPETLRAFFAAHPLPDGATVALDPTGVAARSWGQHRFPTTFIVDAAGVIRHVNRGYGPGYESRLRMWLRPLLR